MTEGREEDARLPAERIQAGKRERQQIVESADSARHGYDRSDIADGRQEKRIRESERIQTGDGLQHHETHQHIHQPDQHRVKQEQGFTLHLQETAKALKQPLYPGYDTAADAAAVPEAVNQREPGGEKHHQRHGQVPEIQFQASRRRSNDLLHEKGAEGVPLERQRKHKKHPHRQEIPDTLHHDGSQHFLITRALFPGDDAAAHELPRPGKHDVDEIPDIGGVPGTAVRNVRHHRREHRPPAQHPEYEGRDGGDKEQTDMQPAGHLEALQEGRPVNPAESEPHQHARQQERQRIFNRFSGFRCHRTAKIARNRRKIAILSPR